MLYVGSGGGGGYGGGSSSNGGSHGGVDKPPSDNWYMLVGEEQHGPYTLDELQRWVVDGSVDGGTYVSNGGEWVRAKDAI